MTQDNLARLYNKPSQNPENITKYKNCNKENRKEGRHRCSICGVDLYCKWIKKEAKYFWLECLTSEKHDAFHVHLDTIIRYSKLYDADIKEFNQCLVTTFEPADRLLSKGQQPSTDYSEDMFAELDVKDTF